MCGRCHWVRARGTRTERRYCKVARKLDQNYHGTQPGTIGPIEARLREHGKPDEHAASGLVLGAFGELSADFCGPPTPLPGYRRPSAFH